MHKKRAILLILIGSLILGFMTMPTSVRAQTDDSTIPTEEIPTEEILGNSEVLLIQNTLPWARNANVEALTTLGKSFDVINSATLGTMESLNEYAIVMLASSQPRAYYQNINDNLALIEAFLECGGVYIAQACDQGYTTNHWLDLSIIPGGVTHVFNPQQLLTPIVPNAHPLFTEYATIANPDSYLDGWTYSTHGYFTNVPEGAEILIVITGTAYPTFIKFTYGKGTVLATMQTMEWGYHRGRPELLLNEIAYAQTLEWAPYGMPLFSDILSILPLGIVAGVVVISRRRKVKN